MITIFITSYINFLRYKPKPILPPGIALKRVISNSLNNI
jgi:hypothetical protein